MLRSVKFAEDKVITFLILLEKCSNSATLSFNLNPVQVDQINLSGIVERYIVFKTSGSVKERTQTSIEMGAGCQRNGCWLRRGGVPERLSIY